MFNHTIVAKIIKRKKFFQVFCFTLKILLYLKLQAAF